MPRGLDPVSYTHLKVVDVVDLEALLAGSEGQQVAQRRDDILVGKHRDLFLGGEAVSYTHLDVYKRQIER